MKDKIVIFMLGAVLATIAYFAGDRIFTTETARTEKPITKTEAKTSMNVSNIFQWHADKKCLELSCNGTSIIIEGIDLDFAESFANHLGATLLHTRTPYLHPDVQPVVTLDKSSVVLKLWKYPAHPDNQ